jgi:hypothetical protein
MSSSSTPADAWSGGGSALCGHRHQPQQPVCGSSNGVAPHKGGAATAEAAPRRAPDAENERYAQTAASAQKDSRTSGVTGQPRMMLTELNSSCCGDAATGSGRGRRVYSVGSRSCAEHDSRALLSGRVIHAQVMTCARCI